MPLWYRRVRRPEKENIDLVAEFLDVWLATRKLGSIDPGELAGVIDVLYDMAPPGTKWALLEVRPHELAAYINVYMRDDQSGGEMMKSADHSLKNTYVGWIRKGHQPPPIMISGVIDEEDGDKGILLIDGRHRIHAAVEAGLATIQAYLPVEHIPFMDEAVLT
jgi:hypothetical protein